MKIRLTKLKEAPNPVHPNNITKGLEKLGELPKKYFKPPSVGAAFYISYNWRTSTVQEILTKNTFRTHNSIYEWEVMD